MRTMLNTFLLGFALAGIIVGCPGCGGSGGGTQAPSSSLAVETNVTVVCAGGFTVGGVFYGSSQTFGPTSALTIHTAIPLASLQVMLNAGSGTFITSSETGGSVVTFLPNSNAPAIVAIAEMAGG